MLVPVGIVACAIGVSRVGSGKTGSSSEFNVQAVKVTITTKKIPHLNLIGFINSSPPVSMWFCLHSGEHCSVR
jgi:hypothetical protein